MARPLGGKNWPLDIRTAITVMESSYLIDVLNCTHQIQENSFYHISFACFTTEILMRRVSSDLGSTSKRLNLEKG